MPAPRSHLFRITALPLLASLLAVPLLPAASASAAPTAAPASAAASSDAAERAGRILPVRAAGQSYGSRLTGNPLASSGETSRSYLCTRQYPKGNRNEVLASDAALADIADIGVVTSTNKSHLVNGRPAMTSFTRIAGGELLEGLVRFDALTSISRVVKTRNGFRRVSQSRLLGLEIAGTPVPVNAGNKTQTFGLGLGLGQLQFNAKSGNTRRNGARSNNLGLRVTLPLGAGTLKLAKTTAKLDTGRVGIFGGGAWGTQVPTVLGLLKSGRTGRQPIACRGTDGKMRTNDTADVSVPGVLDVDVTESHAQTRYLPRRRSSAMARSELAGVSLGGGAVTVDAVKARAFALKRTNGSVRKDPRSQVLGLSVGGHEVDVPLDGEELVIDGIAKIETQVVTRDKRGVHVVALRVTLLDALPEPVQVDIGVARAYVYR